MRNGLFGAGMVMTVAVLVAGCAVWEVRTGFEPTAAEERLAGLIEERLRVAPQVAWIKYQNDLPIFVPEREAEVLAAVVAQAPGRGMATGRVEEFFAAQMEASRVVQADLTRLWKRGNGLPTYEPASLKDDIRPQLDRMNGELLAALAAVDAEVDPVGRSGSLSASVVHRLRAAGFSWRAAWTAARPLRGGSDGDG